MKFFNFAKPSLTALLGGLCLLLAFVDAAALKKRSTQVSLQSYTYSSSVLAGRIKVQNIAYTKSVQVFYAQGSAWISTPINAVYSTGPDSTGYEYWTFSGNAPSATQFFIKYIVNSQNYYDPGNNVNYQISATSTSTTTTSSTSAPTSTSTTRTTTRSSGTRTIGPIKTLAFEDWLTAEYETAEIALKRNIGSSSNTLIPKGVVIASPSTSQPDYYYQWTRDASCVIEHIVNNYLADGSDLQYVLDWVEVQLVLQRLNTPSGGYTSGGLGEPKFRVDNTAYNESWGRPQRDGPALRANTLMKFATKYITVNNNYVRTKLYDSAAQGQSQTVIKADLDYVVSSWSQSGFDLWEEIQGLHYYTIIVSYRSMVEGAQFATLLGDSAAATIYQNTANSMVNTIRGFWKSDKGYIVETQNTGRSGLDCAVQLGALRAPYIFKPSSAEILGTTHKLISSFQSIYTLNSGSGPGYGIGRYPEDVYDGVGTSSGNPWFICTATVAHTLYAAAHEFSTAGSVTISSVSLDLFKRAYPSAATGTYSSSTPQYSAILAGFKTLGDGFLEVVKRHSYDNGSLSEQFNRNSGFSQGARDLTWSYEAIIEAIKARSLL